MHISKKYLWRASQSPKTHQNEHSAKIRADTWCLSSKTCVSAFNFTLWRRKLLFSVLGQWCYAFWVPKNIGLFFVLQLYYGKCEHDQSFAWEYARCAIFRYLANFYRLVRVPAWLWNLEFCTKIWIWKSLYHFLRVWRHKNVSQSFRRVFRTFWPFFALLTRVLSILWPG